MTEQTLELAMLLPREAECGKCVDEVGRELGRLDGVHAVEADVPRGLLNVRFDESTLGAEDVRTFARRAGVQAHCADHCPVAVHDHGQLDLLAPLPGEDGSERRVLHVTGMDCADCAVKLQGALRKQPGVRAADVNFGAATLTVAIDPAETDLGGVFTAVRRLGYDTVERKSMAAPGAAAAGLAAALPVPWFREHRALLTLLSGALVVTGFVAGAVAPAASPWLFAAAMVAGGIYMARAAFFSLRARQVDMNVLMTLAALGAAAIGQWSEAGLVVFLFGLGTWLQVATLERTRRAISGLMALTPPEAVVLRGGEPGSGDRRIAPGRQGARRPGVRRLDRGGRRPAPARHDRRSRQHHRQDRPPGGGGAGAARPRPEHRRPFRRAVYADRGRPGGGSRVGPAASRRVLRHLVLPRPRTPDHQLPVRPRDLHAGEHPRRPGPRHPQRRAHQGRRLPGTDGEAWGRGLRQDGDAHRGKTAGHRRGRAT